jgi:16S rRNA (adenine1518-N6/adenine1519-N6)-dimethyltransferase
VPRKFGQHFLTNQATLAKLAAAACPERTPRVVEIGPGRGALTTHLLSRTDELHALELDQSLVTYLEKHFEKEPKLHVHHADVLRTDLSQWGRAVVTGNLPYYITSPIIEKFLNLDAAFSRAMFLMQWEVAQRVVAQPGSRDYGYLSVFTQLISTVEIALKVPPGAFSPPPQVDSAAVVFQRKAIIPENWRAVLKLASRAFAQKRKTLRNNLRPFYGAAVDDLPEANQRAEQLSLDQFIGLHNRLVSYTETS